MIPGRLAIHSRNFNVRVHRIQKKSAVKISGWRSPFRVATTHLQSGNGEFGGAGVDCTVRNRCATGATVEVASPVNIPTRSH
jgi:hypothetical protein